MNQRKPESSRCAHNAVSMCINTIRKPESISRRVIIMGLGYVPNVERRDQTMNQRKHGSSRGAHNVVFMVSNGTKRVKQISQITLIVELEYVPAVEKRDPTMNQRKPESSNTVQTVVSIGEIHTGHEERIGIGPYQPPPPQFKSSALILELELDHVRIGHPLVPGCSQHLGFNVTKTSAQAPTISIRACVLRSHG